MALGLTRWPAPPSQKRQTLDSSFRMFDAHLQFTDYTLLIHLHFETLHFETLHFETVYVVRCLGVNRTRKGQGLVSSDVREIKFL